MYAQHEHHGYRSIWDAQGHMSRGLTYIAPLSTIYIVQIRTKNDNMNYMEPFSAHIIFYFIICYNRSCKGGPVMKIERISQDKIRIFLTFDDLSERGIKRDDLWREMSKLQELFAEMMDHAYTELGFDASGSLAVEVFAMPAQGMVVIVTRTHWNHPSDHADSIEEDELDDVYEMEVTLEESDTIVFAFRDFEDFIEAAHTVRNNLVVSGALYQYNGQWIFHAEPSNMDSHRLQSFIATMAEYGEAVSVTSAVLEEYGKCIIAEDAVAVICTHFNPRRS